MDMLIMFLLIAVIFVVAYFVIMFFEKMKKEKSPLDNQVIESKIVNEIKKEEVENIIETKTIHYMQNDKEEEVSFKVVHNNGGILKLAKSDRSLTEVFHASTTFYNTPDATILGVAGMIVGDYDSCVNQNHLCILGYERMRSDYYIDINDISKIEVKVYLGTIPASLDLVDDDIDSDDMERINIIVYTKMGSSFDGLEYDISERDNVDKFLALIKKVNSNIIFDYMHEVHMTPQKYDSIKYSFEDKLSIKSYVIYCNADRTFVSNNIAYEINIEFSDIIESDVTNYKDDCLCININTTKNIKYFLIFADNEGATMFYNELKSHLK